MSDNYLLYDPAAFGALEIKEDTRDAEILRLRTENEKLRAALSRAAKELEFVKVNSQYRFAAEAARDAEAALKGLDDE